MIDVDASGARASNAGDEFHELWALQRALSLLDNETDLQAVSVEGLRSDDEAGAKSGAWDGVDCAFYYGGDTLQTAKRVVLDQLKYSTTNPGKEWSVARFCAATNKEKDNSLVARLANAFAAVQSKRPDLAPGKDFVLRLVSNQKVDAKLLTALTEKRDSSPDRQKLCEASGLDTKSFGSFTEALDLSQTGAPSRYALDEAVVASIAAITEADARADRDELLRWIRQKFMMPDRPREAITRASLLIQIAGSTDPATLFPCEAALMRIDDPVLRAHQRDHHHQSQLQRMGHRLR